MGDPAYFETQTDIGCLLESDTYHAKLLLSSFAYLKVRKSS
jgi:hypothetical protein